MKSIVNESEQFLSQTLEESTRCASNGKRMCRADKGLPVSEHTNITTPTAVRRPGGSQVAWGRGEGLWRHQEVFACLATTE